MRVDSDLLDAEMTEVYNKALSELPERCKLIFLLAREERMKHKEIAQALSITGNRGATNEYRDPENVGCGEPILQCR